MTADSRLVNVDELKRQIAGGVSLSQVVEQISGLDLQSSGGQFKACCPFHAEDTPSFYVNDGKGLYHCFGCKAGGDSIDFVQVMRKKSFVEALEVLAGLAGVDIEKFRRPLTDAEKEQAKLAGWLDQFFDSCVAEMRKAVKSGKIKRITDPDVAAKLRIGYCPKPPKDIPKALKGKDYLFEDRIIFPMLTPAGKPVGFKARERDGKKMYSVDKEFPLHRPVLFGLHEAREHTTDELIVVEGEYDVQTCHELGFKNVVGISGSFSDSHWELLQDIHIKKVCFALDPDTGGATAAKSVAERFWNQTTAVRIAALPPGTDPDELLRDPLGQLTWGEVLKDAKSALEWLLWQKWHQDGGDSVAAKMAFVTWIRETYGSKLRQTDQAIIINEVSRWLKIPEIDIHDFIRAESGELSAEDSERVIMAAALRSQGYFIEVRKKLAREDLFFMRHQRVWNVLEILLMDGLDWDIPTVKVIGVQHAVTEALIDTLLAVPDSNLMFHETRVLDLALRRQGRDEAIVLRDSISDPTVDPNEAIGTFTQAITSKVLRRDGGTIREISEQVDKAMDTLHERMANPDEVHGISLGSQFPNLTQKLQGFQPGRIMLLAASSGRGKSTILLQWSVSMAIEQAVPCDFISLEQDETELLFKIAAHVTGIDGEKITGGRLDVKEAKLVEMAMMKVRKSPLRIYAPDSITPTEFLLYAREQRISRRTEVFFVDYAQLVTPDAGTERQSTYDQLAHFGRVAKMKVARAMECTVVCAAQLKRDAAAKERPTKEDIGDCYQLSRDADTFMILSGDDESETIDFWLDKNRQGAANLLLPVTFKKGEQTLYEAHGGAPSPNYRVMAVESAARA